MAENGAIPTAGLSNNKPTPSVKDSVGQKRSKSTKMVFPSQRDSQKDKIVKMTRSALHKHIRLIKTKLHRRNQTLRIRVLMQEEFEDKYVRLNQAGFESDDEDDEVFCAKKKKHSDSFADDKDIDEEWDFGDGDYQNAPENPQENKRISIIEELYG
ncbi:unnamed protein product [Bursaphelenchus xylophilus]|uniref:(pine wood nematode) hypothetical protein n=1 Tax=Bursaphelenchus xylophilus TaxID=6326 RepID=A0A1I7S5T1_BURXY|nr:unnamed protein product [Bursaphelenchus xylophilus]CAG9125035.1 unnamed protein product [Bursaphelenchus xylophilus]